jgi:8-oxo-dGTP pyrophosphatase MutT (NUDIX family)
MKKPLPGAGFVVYRKFNDGIKFLGLKGPKFLRDAKNGIWDLPKGVKEPGESDWDCAVRETLEEAGIFVIESDVKAGPIKISNAVLYLVETTQEPLITANPVSGIMEHEGYCWLEPTTLENESYEWLKPFISWARKELNV